jgi:hypothetical protein
MAMVGHKTESIYRRYAIVDHAMLQEGAAKLAAYSVGNNRTWARILARWPLAVAGASSKLLKFRYKLAGNPVRAKGFQSRGRSFDLSLLQPEVAPAG